MPPSDLALGELEALAGAGLAGLLALFFARIAHQVAGLLEGGAQLGIELLEGAGDTVSNRTGLAGDAAASDVGGDIDLILHLDGEEGDVSLLGEVLVGEVVVERAAVGDQLARAFGDTDAGGGGLTATGAGENGGFSAHG